MSDMTCKELRWYFEDHLRDAEIRSARGAVAEHVATCADCSRFVAEQRELGRTLRQIRESASSVPQSLDTSVLLNYRQHMASRMAQQRTMIIGKFRPTLVWSSTAVAAGILIVAGFLLLSRHEIANSAVRPAAPQVVTIPVIEVPRTAPLGARRRPKPKPARSKRVQPSPPEQTASRLVRPVRSLPEGFRSLMYCDELSCPADMEMIRVQLPSSAMPRQVSGFIQTSGSVTADVLVGPDGIARGIRFEEIEF
jgi:hypothetical protein